MFRLSSAIILFLILFSVSNTGSKDDGDMKSEAESILPTPKITLFPPEDVQLGWRGTHCVGAGMINVGNTCYLNSTLQVCLMKVLVMSCKCTACFTSLIIRSYINYALGLGIEIRETIERHGKER
jgi:ubiquitin C-terminal hydrolase